MEYANIYVWSILVVFVYGLILIWLNAFFSDHKNREKVKNGSLLLRILFSVFMIPWMVWNAFVKFVVLIVVLLLNFPRLLTWPVALVCNKIMFWKLKREIRRSEKGRNA